MTQAVNAFGTVIQRDGTEIAEVTNIGGPKLARDGIEATHHRSPDMWRERIKGLKDAGEVSMDLNFLPFNATHNASTGILADFADDTTISTWTLIFPDSAATTWTFPAFVSGFEPAEPFDDKLTASVTLTVSGKPTLA